MFLGQSKLWGSLLFFLKWKAQTSSSFSRGNSESETLAAGSGRPMGGWRGGEEAQADPDSSRAASLDLTGGSKGNEVTSREGRREGGCRRPAQD